MSSKCSHREFILWLLIVTIFLVQVGEWWEEESCVFIVSLEESNFPTHNNVDCAL